jgi:hypothetical protein
MSLLLQLQRNRVPTHGDCSAKVPKNSILLAFEGRRSDQIVCRWGNVGSAFRPLGVIACPPTTVLSQRGARQIATLRAPNRDPPNAAHFCRALRRPLLQKGKARQGGQAGLPHIMRAGGAAQRLLKRKPYMGTHRGLSKAWPGHLDAGTSSASRAGIPSDAIGRWSPAGRSPLLWRAQAIATAARSSPRDPSP